MKSIWKRILFTFSVLMLTCISALNVTAAGTTIARAEWIHNLVSTFDMTVEDGLMPDDYYGDIADSEYYNDILLAVNFGVIDLEAGEEFHPDDAVTREFAAQTLNACLGYELEDAEYTMSDYEDLQYPQAAQIAINENWFKLVDGAFEPDTEITIAEQNNMINFAKNILQASVIEENHENVYEFSENVIEIPEETVVELLSDTEVMVYDTSLELMEGDSIAVYSNGLAYTYKIISLEEKAEGLLITGEEIAYEDAVASVDAEGVIEADLSNFVPAEDVTLNVEYEEEASTYGLSRISGSKKIKDINLKKNIGGGTIACKISNLKVYYKINNKGYQFTTKGTTIASYTISGKKDLTLTLGYINIAGVGKISVDMIYSADGSATLSYSYNFETGIEKNFGSPTRKIRQYSTPTWHFSAQAGLKASCKVGFYVDVPSVANGSIYGEAGVKSEPAVEVYGDGKQPTICMDLPAYVFATVGYNLEVLNQTVASETIEIYNRNNSPCRVCYHIEDGNQVSTCSRPESSSSVGKRKYYSVGAVGGGTYSGNCFVAPSVAEPIFEYELDEDENATITKYIGSVYCLTIPEELDGYPVVAIGDNAFKGNAYLGSVVIPDSVTSIGKNAFNGCVQLTNINLPNNSKFTYIDEGVLANTSSLRNVEMSDFITEIKNEAFYQSGLVSLHLNDHIVSIGKKAFYGCQNLSDLVLPKYLEKFGGACFGECDALEFVEIPRYITSCSDELYPNSTGGYGYTSPGGMFSGCDHLKRVTFANGITKVVTDLFKDCTGLEEISFPDTVTEIQSKAFYNCTNLKKVNLPSKLTKIGILSFAGCDSLEEIEIPDAVTVIDCCAFRWCENLSNVKLSANLKEIGTWAFADCISLQELVIPKKVDTVIRYYDGMTINKLISPFEGCDNLNKVVLQDGMENIPANLFRWCTTGLEEVVIPDSVIKIGENAFNSCRSLKTINLPDNLVSIESAAFIACSSLETIEIPDTVNSMGTSIFEECSSLTEVKLPKYRVGINVGTFKNCISLSNIKFPDTLQYIYANAFEGCEKLDNVIVPKGFKGVESQAFKNCKRLTSVELYGDYISNNAFEGCLELVDVKMSNSIYSIGKAAFLNCSNLNKIQLSTSLKEIPANAFEGCTFLNDLVIPYGVISIGDEAFKNCTSLINVSIPQNVTIISSNAFSYPGDVTVYGVAGSYAEEYANDNGMTFVAQDIKVESVNVLQTDFVVNDGSTIKIPIDIVPENCSEEVVWKSSNADVATVNNTGTVKGEGVGECEITISIGGISKICKVVVKQRHVGLKLNAETQLIIGENMAITCMSSDNVEVKANELMWWSSNPGIATVDQNGIVTAHAKGKVTIEVWLRENTELERAIDIEIIEPKNIEVTGITLDKTILEMETKTTQTLVASVTPSDASVTSVVWSSDNEAVATVKNGKVTALKAGTATITATTKDGNCSASCVVTVTGHGVTGVELSKESITLIEGNCTLLEAIVSPVNADDTSVDWSVSDENAVTIDSTTGIVKGIAEGTATITVTTNDGGYEAVCEVEVVAADESAETVPVTEITIETNNEVISEENTVEVGKEFTLSASVEPAEATNQNIIWISSDKNIATVSEDGVVTTKGVGEVTFTAVSENGAKQAEITIQILPVGVTGVEINPKELELLIGEEASLQATILPENALNQEVSWSSSQTGIVTVDANGQIKANAVGTAIITVTTADGEFKASCTVTVKPILITSINLDNSDLLLTVGDKEKLTAIVLPDNATDKTIEWSSGDTEVAMVDDKGNVTAIAEGTTNIIAKATDGSGVEVQCSITVTKKQEPTTEEPTTEEPTTEEPTTEQPSTEKPSAEQPTTEKTLPTVGTKVTISVGQYKITKSSTKTKEVTFVKPKSSTKTSVSIPSTVKIDGYTYKVTEISAKAFKNNKKLKSVTIGKNVKKIGKEAFYNCKNLKKITIKSSVLKSVGKNAIKNINKKATIKVPKKKLQAYKKLFKSKTGYKKTMKIKK